jgi:glyoxylase-like metal-dependent hydrolase (beta-lactamase superfamily II)
MTDYLHSLERLLGFDISLILPGHGPMVGKPEAKIKEYIKHRMEREVQVLAALRAGHQTIGDITQLIYKDMSAALQRVAEFSVQAHLEKLMRDGRVKLEGGRYLLLSDN